MKKFFTSLAMGASIVASTLSIAPEAKAQSCSSAQNNIIQRAISLNDQGDAIVYNLDNIYSLGTKDRLMLVQELGSYERNKKEILNLMRTTVSRCGAFPDSLNARFAQEGKRLNTNQAAIAVWSANNWR